jgi:simple sugar transport system ATP-binding protein
MSAIAGVEQRGNDITPALELAHITKRFGALPALVDVSLVVRPGTVHALLGENGAGKTTLMRIAFGMLPPDDGNLLVHGRPLRAHSPADAIAAGIGMVHQHFTLVPAMTVAENIALGGHGRLRVSEAEARVREISGITGFALDPAARVDSLGVGAQQRVEIAKALARRARILVLDEPTAVLAPAESDELLRWLRGFVAAGNAAVLITHKLREALAVADDVTVLRRGRIAFRGPAGSATADALTVAMIGGDLPGGRSSMAAALRAEHRPPLFRANRIRLRDETGVAHIHEASFTIHPGEIVGVVGVEGSGQRALLRALAGRMSVSSGTLERPAVVGFVPEDRHADAVLLDRTLTENVALRGAGARTGVMDWASFRDRTSSLLDTFDVRAPGTESPMRALSGGNQQKLVLARELGAPTTDSSDDVAQAIVVENPTRGLDVRATVEVHARLRTARDRGAAVILYSSDLDEVLALAGRTLVVHAGTVRETTLDREAIGRAMLGLP